jgi:two-component system alkaline phosphatase synthesis response regulator PhoP
MNRVLLVDDDLSFLTVIKYLLQKNGFRVVSCSSGKVAMELLKSDDFDVVISDYRMGEHSGLAVSRVAWSRKPRIPVFIVTAYSDGLKSAYNQELWGQPAEARPDRVFSKPVDEKALITAIRGIDRSRERGPKRRTANRGPARWNIV